MTTTCQWMLWHPRSKDEADAQRKVLEYLLHITEGRTDLKAMSRAQRRVVEEQELGREQVRDEASALLRYIEEHFP
jgi:hypothetical protein